LRNALQRLAELDLSCYGVVSRPTVDSASRRSRCVWLGEACASSHAVTARRQELSSHPVEVAVVAVAVAAAAQIPQRRTLVLLGWRC
jgi:hypothetical protein